MNKLFQRFIILPGLALLMACDPIPKHANVDNVILSASIARLSNLVGPERKDLNNCCSYAGIDPKGRKKFTPQQGFWVRVSLNNKKLARASLLNSCGTSLKPITCTEQEVTKKIRMAFKSNHYDAMYGKGLTRFILYDGQGEAIDRSAKHGGHKIVSLRRDGDTDHFTIGPVRTRPREVSVFMSTSLQEFKHTLQ